jgi:nitroreductase
MTNLFTATNIHRDTGHCEARPGKFDAAQALREAMNWRYAVRQFSDEQVSDAELDQLLESMRQSPSAYGLQPYQLIVVASRDIRNRLLEHAYGQQKVVDCSHLLVLAAHRDIGDELVDRYVSLASAARGVTAAELAGYGEGVKAALAAQSLEQRAETAHRQAFIALGTLTTSAALLGIDCCPMSGFDPTGFDAVLDLGKSGLTTSVICAIGRRHPDDASALYPRVRVPREQLIWVR